MYPGTVRPKQSGSIRLIETALRSLVARRRPAKKVSNVHFLCLVQVTRIYIAVEETLLDFGLASKRVMYRGGRKKQFYIYKRMDRFCAKLYNLTVQSVQTHKSL